MAEPSPCTADKNGSGASPLSEWQGKAGRGGGGGVGTGMGEVGGRGCFF